MQQQPYLNEWIGSEEQFAELFSEATECACVICGSTLRTVLIDAISLGIENPVCCEVL